MHFTLSCSGMLFFRLMGWDPDNQLRIEFRSDLQQEFMKIVEYESENGLGILNLLSLGKQSLGQYQVA